MEIQKINELVFLLERLRAKLKKNQAELVIIEEPKLHELGASEDEKEILSTDWNENRIQLLQSNPLFIRKAYFNNIDDTYAKLVFSGPNTRIKNCYYINNDYTNDYVNVVAGYRNSHKKLCDNYIKIFGSSRVYSFGCEDNETLTAFLHQHTLKYHYGVLNYGVRGADLENAIYTALDTEVSEGDIFIIYDLRSLADLKGRFINIIKEKNFHFTSLSNLFVREHNYGEVFFDIGHLGPRGNKIVAEKIFEFLNNIDVIGIKRRTTSITKSNDYDFNDNVELYTKLVENRRLSMAEKIDSRLPDYLFELKKYNENNDEIGSIVMNCNPFTLGHQYLIEYAANKVKTLIIFVVEEDKSYFKFEHRIEMVKRGVEHLKNVIVLPSGNFIISSITFPEYFSKESNYEVVSAVHDLEIFAYYIAPTLNIKTRFVGEEPSCVVTNGYNQEMKRVLKNAGLHVEEIKRKENEEGVISATKVRQLIAAKDIESIKKFVPYTTLQYLKELSNLLGENNQ